MAAPRCPLADRATHAPATVVQDRMSAMRGNPIMSGRTGDHLTQRDEAVLLSLLRYRYLTTSQVRRLHFPSQQTAGRRLRVLRERGFVAKLEIPGVPEFVETLAKRGAEVVAAALGVTPDDIETNGSHALPPTDPQLRNALAVADFRIALTEACDASDCVTLLGFVPGHARDPQDPNGRRRLVHHAVIDRYDPQSCLTHDPDAAFALQVSGATRLYFLEIDRITAPGAHGVRSFTRLIDFYESLRAGGTYSRYLEILEIAEPVECVRVLVVAASEARARALATFAAAQPRVRKLTDLFWIAPRSVLESSDLLATCWHRAAANGSATATAPMRT
jgi:hypothetical protein